MRMSKIEDGIAVEYDVKRFPNVGLRSHKRNAAVRDGAALVSGIYKPLCVHCT